MRPFRFLHASDLHLGEPLRGLTEVPEVLRGLLVDAPYRAAERVFDAAIKESVDFLILAGDVIAVRRAGPRGLVFLDEQFARLAARGIGVYWALGPHDDAHHWPAGWPNSQHVTLFPVHRVERCLARRDGEPLAYILGRGVAQHDVLASTDFVPDGRDLFSIGVAHGPADAAALSTSSIHYWALGGEHERRSLLAGSAHYCGSPQGRSPEESQSHGCTLVHVDSAGQAQSSFVPTDAVRYLDEHLDVPAGTPSDLVELLIHERVGELTADPFGPDLLVRWTITGDAPLLRQLRHGKLAIDLQHRLREEFGGKRPAMWPLSVAAAVHVVDVLAGEMLHEKTARGEFLRSVRRYFDHAHEPLDVARFLPERQRAPLARWLDPLAEPSSRQAVLAEVARLGSELLCSEEAAR